MSDKSKSSGRADPRERSEVLRQSIARSQDQIRKCNEAIERDKANTAESLKSIGALRRDIASAQEQAGRLRDSLDAVRQEISVVEQELNAKKSELAERSLIDSEMTEAIVTKLRTFSLKGQADV